ncbi:MAG TPA: hypothetical protein PKM50_04730 [Methanoregula sp.]|nr:hypothetical protein [Methanoregula sp.]
MGSETYRELDVAEGTVQCLPTKREPVTYCRLCIHCREFRVNGQYVKSPSLAYCVKCRVTGEVDLSTVQAIRCADRQGEGFHSITNIIG